MTLELPATAGGAGKSSVTDSSAATPGAGDGAANGNAGANASATADTGSGNASSLKTIGLITSGAVALLGAGVGVGFHLAQKSAEDDATSLAGDVKSTLGPNGCYGQPDATVCTDLKDANDRASRDRTIKTIGFIGAGVGVAGLVTFLLLPDRKANTTAVHPLVDQHTIGLGAYGRF